MNSKVLIVDDDINILKILTTLLEREGFQVVTADSSEKGLNILRHEKFDLLFKRYRHAALRWHNPFTSSKGIESG